MVGMISSWPDLTIFRLFHRIIALARLGWLLGAYSTSTARRVPLVSVFNQSLCIWLLTSNGVLIANGSFDLVNTLGIVPGILIEQASLPACPARLRYPSLHYAASSRFAALLTAVQRNPEKLLLHPDPSAALPRKGKYMRTAKKQILHSQDSWPDAKAAEFNSFAVWSS